MVRIVLLTATLLTIGSTANASLIVFSNLGPGDSFICCTGWAVTGPASALPQDTDVASPFTPLDDYTLDSIKVALTWSDGTNAADVWFMSDSGGLPGTILESFALTNLPPFGGQTLVTVTSSLHPVLSTGVQYWLAVSTPNDGFFVFNFNNTGDLGHASSVNSAPWTSNDETAGAFKILGTPVSPPPVPEPSLILLLAIGAGCVRYQSGCQKKTSQRIWLTESK